MVHWRYRYGTGGLPRHGPSLLSKSGGDKYFVIPHILHATSMRKFGFIRQCVNLHSEKNVSKNTIFFEIWKVHEIEMQCAVAVA